MADGYMYLSLYKMQQFRVTTTKVGVPELQVLGIHSLDQGVLLRLGNFTKTI